MRPLIRNSTIFFNPIQDVLFRGCSQMRGGGGGWGAEGGLGIKIHKICHTYPTMMKLDTVIL